MRLKKIFRILILFFFLALTSCSLENGTATAKINFNYSFTPEQNKSKASYNIPFEVEKISVSIWRLKENISSINKNEIKNINQVKELSYRHFGIDESNDLIFNRQTTNVTIEFNAGENVFIAISALKTVNGQENIAFFGISEPQTYYAGEDVYIKVIMQRVFLDPVIITSPQTNASGLLSPLVLQGTAFPGALVTLTVTDISGKASQGISLLPTGTDDTFYVDNNATFNHSILFSSPKDKLRISLTQSYQDLESSPTYLVMQKEN